MDEYTPVDDTPGNSDEVSIPQTRNHLWQYIVSLSSEKHITIILTTHLIEEAGRLVTGLPLLIMGQLLLDTSRNLNDGIVGDVVSIRTPDIGAIMRILVLKYFSPEILKSHATIGFREFRMRFPS